MCARPRRRTVLKHHDSSSAPVPGGQRSARCGLDVSCRAPVGPRLCYQNPAEAGGEPVDRWLRRAPFACNDVADQASDLPLRAWGGVAQYSSRTATFTCVAASRARDSCPAGPFVIFGLPCRLELVLSVACICGDHAAPVMLSAYAEPVPLDHDRGGDVSGEITPPDLGLTVANAEQRVRQRGRPGGWKHPPVHE